MAMCHNIWLGFSFLFTLAAADKSRARRVEKINKLKFERNTVDITGAGNTGAATAVS